MRRHSGSIWLGFVCGIYFEIRQKYSDEKHKRLYLKNDVVLF